MATYSVPFKNVSELRQVKIKHQFQAVIDDGRIEFCLNAVEMFSRLEVQIAILDESPCMRVRPSCCGVDIGLTTNVPSQFYDAINCKPEGYFGSFTFTHCCSNGWFYAL